MGSFNTKLFKMYWLFFFLLSALLLVVGRIQYLTFGRDWFDFDGCLESVFFVELAHNAPI